MKLQGEKTGRKGHLSVATEVLLFLLLYILEASIVCQLVELWWYYLQIYEVAPSLYMVELRKAGGDTLEFHKVGSPLMNSWYLRD